MGVSVSDTMAETMTVMATVIANSRNRRPTMPPISSSGMKTAISERLMEMMVNPISPAPFNAASCGFIPSSMWR